MKSRYYGLDPFQEGALTIGCQKLGEILDEMKPLYSQHFAETEKAYLDTEYDPNYPQYIAAEDRGDFVLFTIREGSTLIGYMQYYVYLWGHSQRLLHAKEDAFYILPEHRGRHFAGKVLDYTEHFLRKLGCKYVGMTSKAPVGGADIGPYLETRDYREVAVYYVKELER